MRGVANIIFDFDGTLSDSREDIASAQLWVLERLGVTGVTKETLFPHIGKSLQETFGELLPSSLHSRIPEAVELYAEYYPPRSLVTTSLFPGVRETLEQLTGCGKKLAIASTKRGSGLIRAAGHFGITQFFVQLQGSDNLPYKPDPALLLKILRDQHWDPRETLMVGDTLYDILAGRRAGLATCGVTYGALTEQEMRLAGPDHLISRFRDLLDLIENHQGRTS